MVFLCYFEFCFSPFFSAPVFISCLFRVNEWHNYFTSVIDLYNRLLSKISPFRNSGEFSITKGLKFGFSLFCRVLLLALFFFFVPVLFCVYFVVANDITILPASSICITDCCQKLVLLEPLENLVLRTV